MFAYSVTTRGFYVESLQGHIPDDAIRGISAKEHQRLLVGLANGQAIQKGDDGLLYLAGIAGPTIDEALTTSHQLKVAMIDTRCEEEITNGFWSSALGDRHLYGSQIEDQLNLTGVILAGLDSPYACRDEQGIKDFRLHTFAQLRQVGDDFTAFKLQLLQKANQIKQQLDLALADGDLAAIEVITWESAQ